MDAPNGDDAACPNVDVVDEPNPPKVVVGADEVGAAPNVDPQFEVAGVVAVLDGNPVLVDDDPNDVAGCVVGSGVCPLIMA